MLQQMSLHAFAQAVASSEPLPGGGCVAALAGGLAAALAAMTAVLTLKKDRFAAVHPLMEELKSEAQDLKKELLAAVDRDAQSYREVIAAMRLPKSTPEQKRERDDAIQHAFQHAAQVPLEVATLSARAMELAAAAADQGNPDMVSDAAVGILMARSAVLGALMNVRINVSHLKDRALAETFTARAQALEKGTLHRESEILARLRL